MMATVSDQKKRIHPHKFSLWIGMASILMMFAGFTSAYIVKRNDGNNWLEFTLPPVFWYSTVVILTSSLTIYLAGKAFKVRDMVRYKVLITVTAVLGVLFTVLQWSGFEYLQKN